MFCLGHQVGRNKAGVAALAHNGDFRGAGKKINPAIEGNQLLGRGYKTISRANNLINARYRCSSVSQGCNRLRAAYPIQLLHVQKIRCRQSLGRGLRRGHANPLNPSHLRWEHRHQHRRRQWVASAGHVAANRRERPDHLPHLYSRRYSIPPRLRHLPFAIPADICRSAPHCLFEIFCDRVPRGFKLSLTHAESLFVPEAIPLFRVATQGAIAILAHAGHNPARLLFY
jgi:hypothetical protein